MSYEFKKLSDTEVVSIVGDSASILIEENGVIKRAPKDEVGGIKVASTAQVGQTIVVKAVDENGNPTEWECADVTSGGMTPNLITVMYDSTTKTYSCDLTYSDIENLMKTGTLLYAMVYYPDNELYSMEYYYCTHYSMPDDDQLHFVNPGNKKSIIFYGSGSISVS